MTSVLQRQISLVISVFPRSGLFSGEEKKLGTPKFDRLGCPKSCFISNNMLSHNPVNQTAPMTRANTTAALFNRWVHGKSRHTQKAYEQDIRHFAACVTQIPVKQVTLNQLNLKRITLDDLQDYSDRLEVEGYSPATRNRRLNAVKSFLSFAHKVGYLPLNVGVALQPPKLEDSLSERILSELQVMSMIALEPNPRNKLLLKLLYYSGCRVGEVAGLKWKAIKPNRDSGQITVLGKGGKTRTVRLPSGFYRELMELRGSAADNTPVFVSRKKCGALGVDRIHEIVRAAGERAGIKGVSPHWLRHCHASHSLERGASIALVRDTLGHSPNANTTNKYLHAKPTDSSGMYLPQ